ncbi:Transcriptional regulator ICP22 [Caprine alphaherpesvirus 1]|uniref:Transcriptional regulator ICP22 homolog n=1 Tax=Caprine alphaherpesvirus 1 TaxID=39944 RepID=A0AAF1D226_9ALPH|nr:Transcriptional regulator ICP22 [Caprine alphaherpesvirus 1]YP_010798704.1 Transcriptional regulator ICP22 [Caprine alphaherpesvirus 1]QBM10904.1 Transcriptional regulator ICP22 [Caprine alphaherpesvirus 1]QBM10912.1 Transcriptional regulator ICP22 [Caprine alphaherpesvirus 1]
MSHGQPCPSCDGSCRLCRSPDRPARAPPAAAADEHARRGPGAFCPGDWRPDAHRLAVDVNNLFRCIATGSALVTADSRALRRALVGFFLLGYARDLPTDECWEALLQLSPEQAGPLRRLLRAAAAAARPAAAGGGRPLPPPARLPDPLFGAECDVSGSDSSDESGDSTEDDDDGGSSASSSPSPPPVLAAAAAAAAARRRQRRGARASGPSRSSRASSSSSSSGSFSSGDDDVFLAEAPAPAPRRAGRRRPAPGWRWSSTSASSPASPPPASPPKRRSRV